MNRRFYSFLAGITVFRLTCAVFLPLAPQEAYYWNYSRHLALSYFDHPPMAAYFIKLTTLLGVSEFSIHLAAILLSIPLTIAIYRLGSMLFDDWVGFWSAVTINLAFIYAVGATIITPDTPLLLFWVLSMIACLKIDRGEGGLWWILLGVFIGAGFASKYPIVFAGLGALIFFLSSRERRKWFATAWPYLALLAAFVVALPVIYWNYSHDWASFAFQTSRRAGEMTRFRADYFFGFLGTVLAIYGFVPIPLLFAGAWRSLRESLKNKSTNYILLASFSLPLMLFLIPAAAKSWVKMNWTAPAFIGFFIAAAAYYREHAASRKWVRLWGRASFYFLLGTFLIACVAVLSMRFYFGKGDYFSGWPELAEKIQEMRGGMDRPYFIAGLEYKIPSELAFYLTDHPETVGGHVVGLDGLQYRYWADPDTLVGRDAIIIAYASTKGCKDQELMLQYFESYELNFFALERGGRPGRVYCIYRCQNYRGLSKGE